MNTARIQWLHQAEHSGDYILYWMQSSMRVHHNHALATAIDLANQHHLPVVVFVAIPKNDPQATLRHVTFMLEGLAEVEAELFKRRIGLVIRFDRPAEAIQSYVQAAQTVVMDFGYLKPDRAMRKEVYAVCKHHGIPVVIVESDLIVPVRVTSGKQEYAAATIRRKVWQHVEAFNDLTSLPMVEVKYALTLPTQGSFLRPQEFIKSIVTDPSVGVSALYHGGYSKAIQRLDAYLTNHIYLNEPLSSDPADDGSSKLSMYLHFGQISSLEIMQRTLEFSSVSSPQIQENIDSFLEQLIVRRELAFNYVYYNQGYDVFETMSEPWAYATMTTHASDPREFVYTLAQLEAAKTHDPYWNAAMIEMLTTGFMHNYMRMYWAKKIIEWSPTHKEAFERTIYLDDKYFLDGKDPNGYTGVAWCYGKHDRAWTERPIFGKLRYMNAAGLKRKFRIDAYVNRWQMK